MKFDFPFTQYKVIYCTTLSFVFSIFNVQAELVWLLMKRFTLMFGGRFSFSININICLQMRSSVAFGPTKTYLSLTPLLWRKL